MRKLTLLIICIANLAFSQEKPNNDKEIIKNCLRLGIGFQRSLSAEIGFARHSFPNPNVRNCAFGVSPKGYYSSLEYIAKSENYANVLGIKAGYEVNLILFSLALEGKYQTNFNTNDFVITPKIGIGSGTFYCFYGYNISTNKNPFGNVGKHQFSVIFNLHHKL